MKGRLDLGRDERFSVLGAEDQMDEDRGQGLSQSRDIPSIKAAHQFWSVRTV
jgi:hypothetical protein